MSEMWHDGFSRRVSCVGDHRGNLRFPGGIAGFAGGPQTDGLSEMRE